MNKNVLIIGVISAIVVIASAAGGAILAVNASNEALGKLESLIKKWPDNEDALFIAGLTSIDLKQYEKAEKYLVELRNSAEYQNEAYYYLAVNAERKQHFETAKAYYRLVDGSLYTVSRRSLISIYSEQNKLNDALRFLTQERVNYPQHASFLYQAQAEILKKMGNKKAALSLLNEAVKNNVFGTLNLVLLADKYHVKKFVQISTDKAVNPTNIMGATKRICEMIVQTMDKQSETKFVAVRFGNVLGSNGSVIPLFKEQIREGGPVTVTHPDIIRFFMTIPEACELVLQAGAMGDGGEIYVFDMGEPVKILDLAKKMIKLSGLEVDKDIKIVVTGLRPGEKLYEELLSDNTKTMPTHNEKILIPKDPTMEFSKIDILINKMVKATLRQNEDEIVTYIKQIVPEFKSSNSVFEKLDK